MPRLSTIRGIFEDFGGDASRPLSEWQRTLTIRAAVSSIAVTTWVAADLKKISARSSVEDFQPHVSHVRMNCEQGDLFCRPRQRQALLHWAYDSRRI
jgi:hypothetical protein